MGKQRPQMMFDGSGKLIPVEISIPQPVPEHAAGSSGTSSPRLTSSPRRTSSPRFNPPDPERHKCLESTAELRVGLPVWHPKMGNGTMTSCSAKKTNFSNRRTPFAVKYDTGEEHWYTEEIASKLYRYLIGTSPQEIRESMSLDAET